jgi:hypothetical protein
MRAYIKNLSRNVGFHVVKPRPNIDVPDIRNFAYVAL